MSKIMRNEDAFTGLEAAIVLIAFIVVAAVFSYVILGAGFFTTQKSQEVVHTGVAQTSSTLELSGPVIAKAGDGALETVSFYLQIAAGGSPVDMKKVTYTVATQNHVATFVDEESPDKDKFPAVKRKFVGQEVNKDNLLEKHEMVLITIKLTDGEFTGEKKVGTNTRFNVDIKPDIGAALGMTKTAPAALIADHNYELY